jgi:hypothetical protein
LSGDGNLGDAFEDDAKLTTVKAGVIEVCPTDM